jgi:hypothetical protein
MQILHSRAGFPADAAHLFALRGLIEGALVTYGRVFTDGTRFAAADLATVVQEMGPAGQAVHEEAMRWRHRHVAHRLEKEWEQSGARLLWSDSADSSPTIRVRVVTSLGPDAEFSGKLEKHVQELANRVWERRLIPLKNSYLAKRDPRSLTVLKERHASAYEPPSQPEGTVGITITIGDTPV